MTQPAQIPATAQQGVATLADARQLSDDLMDVMTTLLDVVETETALVREGKITDAMALEERKTELSRRYVTGIGVFKNSQGFFAASAPELLSELQRYHDVFRSILQVNLTVLATAHAVSEGVIRGVNGEMRKKNMPQTYNATGERTRPNPRHPAPLSVSYVL
jgi:hypothetical protein